MLSELWLYRTSAPCARCAAVELQPIVVEEEPLDDGRIGRFPCPVRLDRRFEILVLLLA